LIVVVYVHNLTRMATVTTTANWPHTLLPNKLTTHICPQKIIRDWSDFVTAFLFISKKWRKISIN
jgi:hypothetical protein